MVHGKGIRLALAIAAALALGVTLGLVVGRGLRSDNIPFFVACGALVGIVLGLGVGYAIIRRQGAHSGKEGS